MIMYRVTHVTLHNICQYSDTSFNLDVGLTAVCGRNGNGKTNLLRALVYGLTGLVDGGWGSQQTLQKDGTADPGYVSVTLSGSDEKLVIRRFSVSGPKFPDTIVHVRGDEQATVAQRRKEVDAYLESVFGIPCSLLFQICWGRQNQLPILLTAPSSVISTFLSNVFNTKYLEYVRDKIKTVLGTIASYDGVDAVLKEQKERLIALPNASDLEARMAERGASIEKQRALCAELQAKSSGRMSPEQWEEEHRALEDQAKKLEDELRSLTVTEMALLDRDTTAYEHMLGDLTSALSQAKDAELQQKSAVEACVADKKAIENRLAANASLYKTVTEELSAPVQVCSLCGAEVKDVEAYRRKQCFELTGFESFELFTASIEETITKETEELKRCDAFLKAGKNQLKELRTLIKTLTDDSDTISSLVAASRRRDKQKLLEGRLGLVKERLASVEAQQPLSEDEVNALISAKADLSAMEDEERSCVEELARVQTSKEFLEADIKRLEEQQLQASVNNNARDMLIAIRDVLSRDRAQARYLDSKIEEINDRLGSFMRSTDLPFSLRLNPQTHLFEYTTIEGHVHPAGHLSGAQLNISAVLLQMAIFEVVQPQINLFLVDEPSEALDDQNKMMMAGLFQRMNNLLPAIEGVMLIVTRDWQLIDSCNNQINISENSYEGEQV